MKSWEASELWISCQLNLGCTTYHLNGPKKINQRHPKIVRRWVTKCDIFATHKSVKNHISNYIRITYKWEWENRHFSRGTAKWHEQAFPRKHKHPTHMRRDRQPCPWPWIQMKVGSKCILFTRSEFFFLSNSKWWQRCRRIQSVSITICETDDTLSK